MKKKTWLVLGAVAIPFVSYPAFAHVGVGDTASFTAGFAHPLGGLDHIAVMIAVGLWAALNGGRAIWVWPLSFISLMVAGGLMGMAQVPLPYVEPAILASVVALGLLVMLAIDLPVWLGALVIGFFAIFHGHAHGTEIREGVSGISYMTGFTFATALLHLLGLAAALSLLRVNKPSLVRVLGGACVLLGLGLTKQFV